MNFSNQPNSSLLIWVIIGLAIIYIIYGIIEAIKEEKKKKREYDAKPIEEKYIEALDNYSDAPTPYDQEVAMRKVLELKKLLPSDFVLSEYSKKKK
jgi:hypothetical protein